MLWLIDRYQNKLSADHMAGSGLELIKVAWVFFFEVDRSPGTGFSIETRTQARLLF